MSQRLIYPLALLFIGAYLILVPEFVTDQQPQQPDIKQIKPMKPTSLPPEFAQYQPIITASQKSYIRIDLQQAVGLAVTASKFRGVPYIEKGQDYPKNKNGEPLVLLAQINCADVPEYPGFPKQGILQFYIQPSDGPGSTHIWGINDYEEEPWVATDYWRSLQRQDYFRVIYHPEIKAATDPSRIPQYTGFGMPIDREVALSFNLNTESVNAEDYQFERYFGGDVYDFFQEHPNIPEETQSQFLKYLSSDVVAKIGGYGQFTQGDPREGIPDRDDWLVLLNITGASIPGGGEILWGDAGTGIFLIHKQDLANRDFSKVAYSWDSH
jgi:uncharacterized protein YwqG